MILVWLALVTGLMVGFIVGICVENWHENRGDE